MFSFIKDCSKKLAAAVIAVSILFASACSKDVVAVVNEDPITRQQLENAIASRMNRYDPLLAKTTSKQAEIRKEVLTELIDSLLIKQELEKNNKMFNQSDLDKYINSYKGHYSDDSFKEMLAEQKISEDAWRGQRTKIFLAELFVKETIIPTIKVDNKAINEHYNANLNDYKRPSAVHMRQILVSTKEQADKIHAKLIDGENFAKMAIEYSISPEASNGGDLAWVEAETFPKVFVRNAFNLPVGSISKVVKSEFGYHIFKVLEKRQAKLLPLSEVKDEIANTIRQIEIEKAYTSRIDELKKNAIIEVKQRS